jgi:hypothetical protein
MRNKNNSQLEKNQTKTKLDPFFFDNELDDKDLELLRLDHQKLSYLCLNLDPFNCDELSFELENLLIEFNLSDDLKNPFEFTNSVLKKLNHLEEQLKKKLN